MPTINQLTAVDAVQAGDLIPIFSQANGDARKTSLTTLAAFIQTLITSTDNKQTQYSAPSATGFSVAVVGTGLSIWLVLTPLAGYAAGTIVLPPVAGVLDKQEILVNTTQAITALTINANGATIVGAPTTLAAGGFFRLRFDAVLDTWYRVG
jgi:hypothetical protein